MPDGSDLGVMALPKLTQLAKGSLSQLKLPPEGFYGTPSTLVIQAHQQSNEKNSIRSQGFSLTRSRSSAISGSPKLMENREIFLCSLQVSLFLRFRTGLSCKTVTSINDGVYNCARIKLALPTFW